jgi:NTE family protein
MTDGLARPIDFSARYADGLERVLILGGGGLYFVAWQVGYLQGLSKRGIDLQKADRVVGTSAGSVVAAVLTSGRLSTFERELRVLAKAPALLSALAPSSDLYPSQLRALDVFRGATDSKPDTVRKIGYAALAAHAPRSEDMRRNLSVAIAKRKWPSAALHTTCVDTYTGERLVVTQETGISLPRAAAASSAVPGLFSPQPIHDRLCMDGGVSGSGSHCDLASGATRAMVLALGSTSDAVQATMTIQPDALQREIAALNSGGTATLMRTPDDVDMTKLMSPAAVPDAMAAGESMAAKDAVSAKYFWDG